MGSEWITLHSNEREVLINVFAISAVVEEDGYTWLYLANSDKIAVDEDITKVKAEMFI